KVADWQKSPRAAANRAWHGKVGKVVRSGADKTGGVTARLLNGKEVPLAEGQEVKAGWHVITHPRTRARVGFDDRTRVLADRGSAAEIGQGPPPATLKAGASVAGVAPLGGAPNARLAAPAGGVPVIGTKPAVTATSDHTNVEVLRGEVEVWDGTGAKAKVAA